MERAPVSPDASERVPDECVLLAIDRTLAVDDVRPVLAAVQALGVWKLGFVTAGPGTLESWFVLMRYLPRLGVDETTPSSLELVMGDFDGPAVLRAGEREWRDVFRLLDSDSGRAYRLAPSPGPLVVDDGLSWDAFVQVQDALSGDHGPFDGLAPAR